MLDLKALIPFFRGSKTCFYKIRKDLIPTGLVKTQFFGKKEESSWQIMTVSK